MLIVSREKQQERIIKLADANKNFIFPLNFRVEGK